MIFCNTQLLQQVKSDFLQRATFATSNKQILQRVTSDFITSNEQVVASQRSFDKNANLKAQESSKESIGIELRCK